MNVRELALGAYLKVIEEKGYSNIVLNDVFQQHELKQNDKGLLTEILYGALQNKLNIEFKLKPFVRTKLKRWQRALLVITVYQMDFLERVPNYAAINEAVEIAKSRGGMSASKVINAILRNYDRNNFTMNIKDSVKALSINTSIPKWIIDHWLKHHSIEETEKIAQYLNQKPKLFIRTNNKKINRDALIQRLNENNIECKPVLLHPDAIEVHNSDVINSPLYKDGYYSIQDVSSMLVNLAVNPEASDIVLDACSAPGGKGLHTLENLSTGHVDFCDIHEHKLSLIKDHIMRLNLKNYDVYKADATNFNYTKQYDKIIVDAPCSGLGVMRRKPEIKYEKSEKDIDVLVELQLKILNHVKQFLKPGGELIYSTCTIHQLENENVAYTFMKANEDIEFKDFTIPSMDFIGPYRQILPYEFDTDGFFIAKFRKKD